MECKCIICGRNYLWRRKSGSTRETCNSCMVNRHRFKRKQKIVEYLGGKCKLCGYNKSVTALQTHHRDKLNKLFNISGSHARSWESVKSELDKCDLLCANCHSEIEFGIIPII